MKRLADWFVSGYCSASVALAAYAEDNVHTTAGWAKCERNPVLGGALGTCFDVAVLRERDTYRMWFLVAAQAEHRLCREARMASIG